MSAAKKRMCLAGVFASSLIAVFWMLSVRNGFVFDDSTLLSRVSLSSYDALFSFYPSRVYLDRPVRDVLLKLLFDLFGDDYVLHHAALVLIHLLNVLLAFFTARRLFALNSGLSPDRGFVGACVAAAIFGAWPNSLMSVQWVSGNNDLMGATFALLSMLFFLRSVQEGEYRGQNIFLTVLFYYFAIRAKEMFYPLPLIFILCEVYTAIRQGKKFRLSGGSICSLGVMALFLAGIVYYKFTDQKLTVDPTNPYYQTFDPVSMLVVLAKYCMRYFDLAGGDFAYEPSTSGAVGLAVMLIGLAAAIVLAVRKKPGFLLSYLAIGLSIAMVLPQVNQIHRLYLYFPAFFVGFTVACAAVALPGHHAKVLALVCLGCILAGNTAGPKSFRELWFSYCDMDSQVYHQLETLDWPVPESHVYIRLEDMDAYTPFYYGPGSILKLVYQDDTLVPSLHTMEEDIDYQPPYVVMEYVDGQVRIVERDEQRTLCVEDVAAYPQPDGSLVLGIVPDKISDSLTAAADGKTLPTVIGEDFISVTVPAEQLTDKSSVQITLTDKYGTKSEPWEVKVR